MENFASINWSNPWLTGIGTAIVSGLTVNLITRFVWSRKDNKEYRRQVISANREIMYALRPAVAEALVPEVKIVKSIISATARKYNLQTGDLLTIAELADDLIKEVMDSSFISTEQKIKYCSEIAAALSLPTPNVPAVPKAQALININYRQKTLNRAVSAVTLMTAIVTGLSTIVALESQFQFDSLGKAFSLSLGAVATPLVAATALSIAAVAKKDHALFNLFERLTTKKKKPKK